MAEKESRELLWQALRLFLLVVLPFSIGMWIMPHVQYTQGSFLPSPDASKNISEGIVSYSFTRSSGDVQIPQDVKSIFPLADFISFPPFVSHVGPVLCFEDAGSYLLFSDGYKTAPDFQWEVLLNNATYMAVSSGAGDCTIVALGQQNTYVWTPRLNSPIPMRGNATVGFYPKTITYPRAGSDYGLLQGIIMIPVAFLLIWYPAAGILRKIHKGMLEQ